MQCKDWYNCGRQIDERRQKETRNQDRQNFGETFIDSKYLVFVLSSCLGKGLKGKARKTKRRSDWGEKSERAEVRVG